MEFAIIRTQIDIVKKRTPRVTLDGVEQNKEIYCDSFGKKNQNDSFLRFKDYQIQQEKAEYTIAGSLQMTKHFVTEDSRKYKTIAQQKAATAQKNHIDGRRSFDGLSQRYKQQFSPVETVQIKTVTAAVGYGRYIKSIGKIIRTFSKKYSTSSIRTWQYSVAGMMFFAIGAMSFFYADLDQVVLAKEALDPESHLYDPVAAMIMEGGTEAAQDIRHAPYAGVIGGSVGTLFIAEGNFPQFDVEQEAYENRVKEMVDGHPIEEMLPYIFAQDREVAMYMIAMAKQESNWGKRVPVLNGEDCFNYWGYRAKRIRMGSGGHTCFDSHEDAVKTVGQRIYNLYYQYERTTPREMLVWKCGYSCDGHSEAGVERWVRTVNTYRNALKSEEERV